MNLSVGCLSSELCALSLLNLSQCFFLGIVGTGVRCMLKRYKLFEIKMRSFLNHPKKFLLDFSTRRILESLPLASIIMEM